MHTRAHADRIHRGSGFTLLELLVALAVTAILLGVGLPAFNTLSANSRQTAEINRFVRHLQLARSYAVKTGRPHVLCPSVDQQWCLEETAWERGYILFEDLDDNGSRNHQEALLRINRPEHTGLEMHSTHGRDHVTYRADGRSAGSNLTLTFCDPESDIPPKAIILSNSGRPRVSDTRWDGTPLDCGD